jgi:hypothetical protein
MRRRNFISFFGGVCLLLANAMPGNIGLARSEAVVERLSVPQSFEFNGESYRLSWSSRPSPHYYKQEYLPSGQTSERFERMILIEATVREVNVKDVVAAHGKHAQQAQVDRSNRQFRYPQEFKKR